METNKNQKPGSESVDEACNEVVRLRSAMQAIINQQPCCEGGGCFYPMHDGEGNYIGEQNVDPLGVIQGMVQTAQDALSPNQSLSDFDKIRQWAIDRNLTWSRPEAQFEKLLEEVCELEESIASDSIHDYVDAIGDCVVVLTIMSQLRGLSIEGCIAHAYDQIKDRKGKLVNGVFVKEA